MTNTTRTIADVKVGDRIVISGEEGTITQYRLSTVGTAKGNALLTVTYDECRQATLIFKNAANYSLDDVAQVSA